MEEFFRVWVLSWRRLGQHRGMAGVAVATLALAMGASTAMFSVFSGLLLFPLPFPQARQLVWLMPASLRTMQPKATGAGGFSPPDFLDYRAQSVSFQGLIAYYPNVATLLGRGQPQHVAYANVTAGFFDVMGVKLELGRGIDSSDEVGAAPRVAVLSDGLWRERFGADPNILGRTVDLDNWPMTIIGVAPPGFDYPEGATLWAPEAFGGALTQNRNSHYLAVVGRLRLGVTLQSAQQEVGAIATRLAAAYPESNSDQGVEAEPLSAAVSGPFRATLWLMMVAGILVLGIACANVANLLLAGAAGRWREMAVRTALGAGRGRLLAQLLAEGLALAVLGGGLGTLLAMAGVAMLRRLRPSGLPQLAAIGVDGVALLFAAAATLATALWFGLAPAWELLRPRPGRSLHRAAGANAEGTRSRFQAWVAGAEVAATVMLVVGAGLMLQSLRRLRQVDPGFRAAQVLTFRASLLYGSLAELNAGSIFFQRLDARLQTLPGVEAAGLVSVLPLQGVQPQLRFYAAGSAAAALREVERPQAGLLRVLPGYFRTLAIPVQGRRFDADDTHAAARVVIVSQSLAAAIFPGQEAIGHSLVWGNAQPVTARIVGVAGDVHQGSLAGAPEWEVYEPFPQSPTGDMSVVARVRGDPLAMLPAMRRLVGELNPQIPVYQASAMTQVLAGASAGEGFRAGLLAAMAVLALLLAAAGIYSVLAHRVAQRQREIGVRMALGASPAQVRRMILGEALRLVLAGAAVGLVAAWALARELQHWLFAVRASDPATLLAAPAILITVGLLASYLPARHATRVDPAITLRCE